MQDSHGWLSTHTTILEKYILQYISLSNVGKLQFKDFCFQKLVGGRIKKETIKNNAGGGDFNLLSECLCKRKGKGRILLEI